MVDVSLGKVSTLHALPAPGIKSLLDAGCEVCYGFFWTDAQAIIVNFNDTVTRKDLDALPHLKLVAVLGTGTDGIDKEACRERGIAVTNTPDIVAESVADLAWGLLLASSRRIVEGHELVHSGEWIGAKPTQLLGHDVFHKVLGIVGMGQIGKAVVRRASGFNMRVVYHSRTVIEEFAFQCATLEELMLMSDYLVVCLPLTNQTRGLIGSEQISWMKPGSYLINVGRGGIVDEVALSKAILDEKIAGAALDVYDGEPSVRDEILSNYRIVCTPHIGSATVETRDAMVALCCRNIISVLSGHGALTPVT